MLFVVLLALAVSGGRPLGPAQTAPLPQVEKVENAGLLFTDNPAGVSGTDAGYSIPLPNQTLWLFGDVFLLDPTSPAKRFVGAVSNCALLVPAGRGPGSLQRYRFLTDPASGLARQALPNAPSDGKEVRYWPYGGWYSPAERQVYLYYARVRTTGTGPFAFQVDGHGLACADARVPERIQFARRPAPDAGDVWWSGEGERPLFGGAVVSGAPGDYLFVIGVQERDGRKRGKLARVRKDRIGDLRAYEYYAGGDPPRWSLQVEAAADVEGLSDFPSELSVSYNPYLGGYLAVHSVGLSERVRLTLASAPWGPYRPIGEIGTPHRALSTGFCYAGKEHPELSEDRGRIIYITYVDSDRYWLQLLKVTLHR